MASLPHLLFLAHRVPYPPTKGDKVRSYHLLKFLATRYRVHLGAFVDDTADFQHLGVLRGLCESCQLIGLNPPSARIKSAVGFLTGEPLTLPYYRSAAMRRWVDGVMQAVRPDAILVFSAAMAQYVMPKSGSVPAGNSAVRRVADLVDVDSDKWRQYAQSQPWPYSSVYRRESRALLRYEREIAKRFDATVFVSAAEADLFRRLAPEVASKVWAVNNGVDSDYFSPAHAFANPYADAEKVLVFTGAMDYWPNVDAVARFAHETFPRIRREQPSAVFCIVGARPTPEVTKLGALPGVRVTGGVADIRPFIAHAKFAVAPLRMARGVQNKVLEAMAMAKPVLASAQAAEGIEAQAGTEFLVAADPDDFARQALQLLQCELSSAIGAAGRTRVLESYAWHAGLNRIENLLSGEGTRVAGSGVPPTASSLASDSSAAA